MNHGEQTDRQDMMSSVPTERRCCCGRKHQRGKDATREGFLVRTRPALPFVEPIVGIRSNCPEITVRESNAERNHGWRQSPIR